MNRKTIGKNNFKPNLSENEAHIWHFDLKHYFKNKELLVKLLSQDELDKAESFHFEIDRNRYICSHGLLRLLISIYFKFSSNSISYAFNSFGKPFIKEPLNRNGFQFNLSHSQDLACYIFTNNCDVGIDIEFLGAIPNFLELAERYFSVAENEQLLSLSKEKFELGFYNCWTSKEAVIKALGEGLSFPLKEFNVILDPLKINQTRNYKLELKNLNTEIFIETFRTYNDYIGASAIISEAKSITYWFCKDFSVFEENLLKK